MDMFNIRVIVPSLDDAHDDKLEKYLRKLPYRHENWTTTVPAKRAITFEKVNEPILNAIKEWFLNNYKDHKYASQCSFELQTSDRYQV